MTTIISRNPKTSVATVTGVLIAAVQVLGDVQGALPASWATAITAILSVAGALGVYHAKTPVPVPDVAAQAAQAVKDYQDQHYADLVRDVRAAVVLDLPFVQAIAGQVVQTTKTPSVINVTGATGGTGGNVVSAPITVPNPVIPPAAAPVVAAVETALSDGAQAAAYALKNIR